MIPVLIENTPMPAADALPERLRGLARRNVIELSTVSWRTDLEALVAALHRLTPQSRPPSQPTRWTSSRPISRPQPTPARQQADLPRPPTGSRYFAGAGSGLPWPVPRSQPRLSSSWPSLSPAATTQSDQADEYVGAISEGLGTNSCVASAIVDVIGLEDLKKLKATPDEIREDPDVLENLSEDEANNIYDNLSECPADKTYLIAQASGVIGSDEDPDNPGIRVRPASVRRGPRPADPRRSAHRGTGHKS